MRQMHGSRWFGLLGVLLSTMAGISVRATEGPEARYGRMLERTCRTDLPLTIDGRAACAIICPAADQRWRELADRLAEAIQRLGADRVPVVPDAEAVRDRLGPIRADLRAKTLILLGDLNTNRAVLPFYTSYYTYCDARYPGGAGYELRTIVRPFGWPSNCLMVGGSTWEGCAAGVERLIERLSRQTGGSLPYLLEVKLGDELSRRLAAAPDPQSDPCGKGGDDSCDTAQCAFTRNAHLYFYTGDELFARRSREAALRFLDCKGDPAGFAVGDYTMETLAAAWRRVSCSPVFSRDELVRLDQAVYQTAIEHVNAWYRIRPEQGIGNRHQTTGGLAWYTLMRGISELCHPDPVARGFVADWLADGAAYCDGLLRHYWDDEDDYQSADSAQNAASYALQAGRSEWFTDGLARRAAERLVMTVDNLGWYAGIQGYGDALPGWERFPLDAGMLMGACAFVYQDPSFRWILERFPSLNDSWGSLHPWGLHQFASPDRDTRPPQPDWITGMRVARFTPYKMDRINSGEFITTSIMDNYRPFGLFARPVSLDLAFDKLCYRAGPDVDDLYLLHQGSAGTTLTTIDVNAIVRCTDAGRLWLVHNTGRRSLYFKNAVYVSNGTNQQPIAPSCELVASANFGGVVMAASRLPDCRGMTWTRNLVVWQDRFFAVIDHLRADQPGQYSLSCNWRTPSWATLVDDRWQAVQDDITFTVLPGSLEGVVSDRPMQRDGATRPTTLREKRSLKAQPADPVVFENVFYVSTPRQPRAYEVRRLAPGVVLVRDSRDGSLALVAAGDRGVEADPIRSDAAVVLVTPHDILLTGGTRLELARGTWTTDTGRISLKPEEAARVTAALDSLWASAHRPAAAVRSADVKTVPLLGPSPVWQDSGPAVRGGLVDGVRFVKRPNVEGLALLATDWIMPLLRAEPRLMGRQGSELLMESRQSQASVISEAEPVLAPLQGSEFTLEMPDQVRIADIDLFGDTIGQTADPLPPGTLRVELTFTNDNFREDRRTRQLDLPRRPTFHNLYKGHCYLFECYSAQGLDEGAQAVRVRILDGPGDRLVISDVQVRSAGELQRVPVELRCLDLDGDGIDEVLTWTPGGSLAVLRSDGSLAWKRHFPAGILALDASDLDGDRHKEVFVSRLDRVVEVFDTSGSPLWARDYRLMRAETGGRYFGDGAAVYGMSAWWPWTSWEPEVLFTSYWFTTRLTPNGQVLGVFRRGGHFTQIRPIPAALPGAGGLAIRSDVPWPGNVPLQWWDVVSGELAWENDVPNGRSVFFELDDYDADGQVEALSASEQGIGLYSPYEPAPHWVHMTDAPPVGVGVVRPEPGDPDTIVYGREDGYVFVMTPSGRVIASTVLDEPLQCLTASGGDDPTVWVGTRTALYGLRLGDLSVKWRRPGAYQTLTPQRLGTAGRIVAVTDDGRLETFDPAGH